MSEIALKTLLLRARGMQKKHYSDDKMLESHLAQGLIKNAAVMVDPRWSIGFMDMDREHPQLTRERLLSAVDCLLYSLSLLSIQEGISRDNLLELIIDRQKMIIEMHDTAKKFRSSFKEGPIAVFDIDGILFPWPSLWSRFKSAHKSSKRTEAELKEKYRLSGLKASEPPIEGSVELLESFKRNGYTIILLSSRPVNRYPEVYMQTLQFLKRYRLVHDLLFFKDHKPISAELEDLWSRVEFFVDDDSRYIVDVKERNPQVCCVHINPSHKEERADLHFNSTLEFYELVKSEEEKDAASHTDG